MYMSTTNIPYNYESVSWLPKATRSRETSMKIRFGNATEEIAIFTSWPIVQNTDTSEDAEITIGSGSHLQDVITMVVLPGTFQDTELPYDTKAHQQFRVRVGVLKDLSSSEPNGTGRLQLLDEKLVSGNMILVLRQRRLELPSQFPSIPWPCGSEKIKNATCERTNGSQDILTDTQKSVPDIGLDRATDKSASLGDNHASVSSESIGHKTPGEAILASALCAGPKVFRSDVYGVELELQEGSLEQDVHAPVSISPQVRSVTCRTEYFGRTLSEKFLAMPFVSGPEGVMFPQDKPALLRFFVGFAKDFSSEGVADLQSMDEEIERTVREWYTPLSSPDGTRDWVSLGSYAVKFRHEGNDREVWVETPLQHFSLVTIGLLQKGIPGYKDDGDSAAPFYKSVISRLPRKLRGRTANLKIVFGNETENFATFTYWPTIKITNRRKERGISIGVEEVAIGGRELSDATCSHLSTFQEPITQVVSSGAFVDVELPYDVKAHKQIRVRFGVLKDLSSSEPNATGRLQLLEETNISGNNILVLRQPALHKPSQLPEIPWPCDSETIKNAKVQST